MRSGCTHHVAHPAKFHTVGQCFDIEVTRETDGWLIRIPEIGGFARASRRAAVELAARECIATRTGIPIGYVAVFVAREIG
ncbi:long chain fatty acid-CoA synthetase Faa4p [Mycobacterium sp.]|uniref:long chain fatty acid-CoA synthetase Faa4p n=1 Tax=Mycobacterium sp. TaxID=1785 RepID=UPI003C71B3A8